MITLKKLGDLPRKTRLRKISRILLRLEYLLRGLPSPDDHVPEVPGQRYLQALFHMVAEEAKLPQSLRDRALDYAGELESAGKLRDAARQVSDIRYGLEDYLGHTPADWDFQLSAATRDVADSGPPRHTAPIYLYLDDVRSPFNVGAIFRAADSFGVRGIFLSEGCATPEHPRAARASMGTVDVIPWQRATITDALDAATAALAARSVPESRSDAALFAVETGGTPLAQFPFPPAGVAVVGSEELGVSSEALMLAGQSAGRVSVPTTGVKGSLNVAVATGIVLYQWWWQITR